MMELNMKLPKYYGLVRFVAQLGALIGCVLGAIAIVSSLVAFQYGMAAGFTAISGGVLTIIGSLAGLGITYCFLALVKAQIDARNMIASYVMDKSEPGGVDQFTLS